MEPKVKNCPNCKHFRKEEETTLLEREGKKVATKFLPKRCQKGNHEIILNWFKTRKPVELECFE